MLLCTSKKRPCARVLWRFPLVHAQKTFISWTAMLAAFLHCKYLLPNMRSVMPPPIPKPLKFVPIKSRKTGVANLQAFIAKHSRGIEQALVSHSKSYICWHVQWLIERIGQDYARNLASWLKKSNSYMEDPGNTSAVSKYVPHPLPHSYTRRELCTWVTINTGGRRTHVHHSDATILQWEQDNKYTLLLTLSFTWVDEYSERSDIFSLCTYSYSIVFWFCYVPILIA